MARRSVPNVPAKNDHPFRALENLKPRPRPPCPSSDAATDRRVGENTAPAPLASGTGEQSLFRRAIGDVAPIRPDNRAEIEVARPLPVPRAHTHNEDDAPSALAPHSQNGDPLVADYADVTPLPINDRVEAELRPTIKTAKRPAFQYFPGLPPLPAGDDPAALFRRAVGNVQPLSASGLAEISIPRPPPEPRQRKLDETAALHESLTFPLTIEDRLDSGEEAAFLRPGLRRRVLVDLRRGRWTPQAKIDLHGLNRDEARAALSLFIATALAHGKRCIRVIHGKGLGSPGGISVLKQLSRGWLAQREEILAFCQANPHEGGAGALLVLLRAPTGQNK
ncbi:MAG: Smr/MutS family protein [Azoarcus sp.]|jgi:DNA-nicking Smr family endonuclease|nr:Smr/MutS family protein [Azoarcus sp.]